MTRNRDSKPGSLKVEITNGPETVVYGSRLTTEQAVEEVCLYLPVVPVAERDRLRAENERIRAVTAKAPHARHCYAGSPLWPTACTCWKSALPDA